MSISDFLKIFVPQDKKFFVLFDKNAENAVKAATLLNQMVMNYDESKMELLTVQIKQLESSADDVTHEIFDELNSTFITPFDREDIHDLCSKIDDVIDLINSSAQKIKLYHLKRLPDQFADLSDLILQATREMQLAVGGLKNMKELHLIKRSCIRINEIENQADDIYYMGISDFFINQKDAIELIKEKEILSTLEMATDSAEDVSDVIKTILVKLA